MITIWIVLNDNSKANPNSDNSKSNNDTIITITIAILILKIKVLLILITKMTLAAIILMRITLMGKQKQLSRGTSPEGFLYKGVLKICSKFTGEHPCPSVISIKRKLH